MISGVHYLLLSVPKPVVPFYDFFIWFDCERNATPLSCSDFHTDTQQCHNKIEELKKKKKHCKKILWIKS